MTHTVRAFGLALVMSVTAACGGGGGGKSSTPATPSAPTAPNNPAPSPNWDSLVWDQGNWS